MAKTAQHWPGNLAMEGDVSYVQYASRGGISLPRQDAS
jgi:hypothetical protein